MQDKGTDTQAVALFAEQPDFGFVALLDQLNRGLAPLGVKFTSGPLTGEDFVVFNNPNMHVIVTVNRTPLPPETLSNALRAPIARVKRHDYPGAVAAHRRYVRISVGEGAHYGSPAGLLSVPLARRTEVLHRAVLALIALDRPLAVHWCPSDMIFLPEEIERTEAAHFPAALAIRPTPLRPEAAGATTGTGIRADGAEQFCGRPLVIAPGPLPLAVSISVAEHLLALFVEDPATLRDRAVIPFSEDYSLSVRHTAADDGLPDGMILVRFEQAEALVDEEDEALSDPEALLAAIRRRQRSERLRTYALCAALAVVMPIPALALFAWNAMRGANLTVTAAAFALALAFITGVEVLEIVPALEVAGLSAASIITF